VKAKPTLLVGLTAWQALFGAGQLSAGQTVLIHAAAGGVGHITMQLAKWKGARVIGIASGRNATFLDELGVDQFVDYTTTRFEDVVSDVDVVPEMFGGDTVKRSLGVLKKGGIFVSIKRAHSPEVAAQHEIRSRYVLAQANTADLQYLATLVDEGHLGFSAQWSRKSPPHISIVLPLCDLLWAFELSKERHTRGKIVLQVAR